MRLFYSPSDTGSTTAKSANTANLSGLTLRVVKLKGGWDIHIKLGGLHKFPYQIKNIVDSNVVIVAAPFAIADRDTDVRRCNASLSRHGSRISPEIVYT